MPPPRKLDATGLGEPENPVEDHAAIVSSARNEGYVIRRPLLGGLLVLHADGAGRAWWSGPALRTKRDLAPPRVHRVGSDGSGADALFADLAGRLRLGRAPLALAPVPIAAIAPIPIAVAVAVSVLSLMLGLWILIREQPRRRVIGHFEMTSTQEQALRQLAEAASGLGRASGLWRVIGSTPLAWSYPRKVNAMASSLVQRTSAQASVAVPRGLVSDTGVPPV